MSSSENAKFSGTYKFKSNESLHTFIGLIQCHLQSEFIPPFAIDRHHSRFIINDNTKLWIGTSGGRYTFEYEFPAYYARGWKLCANIIEEIRLRYEEPEDSNAEH